MSYLTDEDRIRYGMPAYEADGNHTVFTEHAVEAIVARHVEAAKKKQRALSDYELRQIWNGRGSSDGDE